MDGDSGYPRYLAKVQRGGVSAVDVPGVGSIINGPMACKTVPCVSESHRPGSSLNSGINLSKRAALSRGPHSTGNCRPAVAIEMSVCDPPVTDETGGIACLPERHRKYQWTSTWHAIRSQVRNAAYTGL